MTNKRKERKSAAGEIRQRLRLQGCVYVYLLNKVCESSQSFKSKLRYKQHF